MEPEVSEDRGSAVSVLWMAEGQAERDGLSRRAERAGQCLPWPSQHSVTVLHAQRAGVLTALLWPEEEGGLSNPTYRCRSLVSVTTAGNKTHIQVSDRYNINSLIPKALTPAQEHRAHRGDGMPCV